MVIDMYMSFLIVDGLVVDKINVHKYKGLNYSCIIVLKLYIHLLKTTQRDVARILNIEEKSFSKSLNRNSKMSAERILKFCKSGGIDASEFFYNVEVIHKMLDAKQRSKHIEFKFFKK